MPLQSEATWIFVMSQSKPVACAALCYEVTQADLPLSCPSPKFRLWDAHPRVYLPIAVEGRVVCPYCNAEYILIDFKPSFLEGE